jgi:hypothetical protein
VVWFPEHFVVDILAGPLENAIFIVIPIAMGVLGFVLMRNLVWDLVDEVYDYRDHLVVKTEESSTGSRYRIS